MAIRKLILGSNEAMQHEPSLEEPQTRKRKLPPREKRLLDEAWNKVRDEDEVFPKGIDDSMGG
jgi:hypothetical protein